MKKKALRSLTILTLLAIAFSVTAWAVTLVQLQAGHQHSQDDNKTKQKTLREMAQERDIETTLEEMETNVEYNNLRSLKKSAAAVVIGRITEEETSFSGEDHIITKYTATVQRVLQDSTSDVPLLTWQEPAAPLATPLRFVREGGMLDVNGHRVSVKLKGGELLKAGKEYIFFFGWSPNFKAYYLMGGSSGAFLVKEDLRIKPLGSKEGLLKYSDTDLETFINEILKA